MYTIYRFRDKIILEGDGLRESYSIKDYTPNEIINSLADIVECLSFSNEVHRLYNL